MYRKHLPRRVKNEFVESEAKDVVLATFHIYNLLYFLGKIVELKFKPLFHHPTMKILPDCFLGPWKYCYGDKSSYIFGV